MSGASSLWCNYADFYFVIHSLFWVDEQERGAYFVRGLIAFGLASSWFWMRQGTTNGVIPTILSVLMLAVALFGWSVLKRNTRIIAAASVTGLLAHPLYELSLLVQRAPLGLLAILGSFALFGLGTGWALIRKKKFGSEEVATL